jgi:Tat protein secretion system quality control protein TatD with DNase activity
MPWKDTRPSARDPEAARFKTPLDPALLTRLADAHCHPSDDEAFDEDVLRELKTGTIVRLFSSLLRSRTYPFLLHFQQAMSSSLENQSKTVDVYHSSPDNVIPYFGLHPWFSHPITFVPPDALPSKGEHYSSLFPDPSDPSSPHPQLSTVLETFPDPVPISIFIATLESNLLSLPNSNVGEIGLDKAFKIPQPPHISADKSNPKHTDLATPFAHQVKVTEAQVDVAIRLGRNISFHSVRAPQETVEVLKRFKAEKKGWEKIHVCLHSFGGRPESAVQIQKGVSVFPFPSPFPPR